MSKKAARLWQQVFDQLSAVANGTTILATGTAMCALDDLLQQLATLPPQPSAVWKALIQEFQLPRQLGSLACRIASGDPYKANPFLPSALGSAVLGLLVLLAQGGISSYGQLKGLWGPVKQQMVDSGFVSCLKHLMEATAEQLVRCTTAAAATPAAAAATPAAEAATPAAAAAAAAAPAAAGDGGTSHSAAASSRSPAPPSSDVLTSGGLGVLHGTIPVTAYKLLEAHVRIYAFFSGAADAHGSAQEMMDMFGCVNAAATQLMVAGMRHISVMLPTVPQQQQQLRRQQQQQQGLPKGLTSLACAVANCTLAAATFLCGFYRERPQVVLGRGPDYVVWSDLTLLLFSCCRILQQQQQPGSGRDTAAAAPRSSASSSSSGSTQQQRQTQPQPATSNDMALAAWQQVQENCEHLPASHTQLLQLLGVSPQAALWLAALMLKEGQPTRTACECWEWNPHKIATAAVFVPNVQNAEHHVQLRAVQPSAAAEAVVREYQQQLQQWDNTSMFELVLLLLLQAVAHLPADSGDYEFICGSVEAFTLLLRLLHQQQEGSTGGHTPAFTLTMQYEALCMTVKVLTRLQQLQEPAAASSSSGGGGSGGRSSSSGGRNSSATQRTFADAANRAQCSDHAKERGVEVILTLFVEIHEAKVQQSFKASHAPAAAAAQAGTTQAAGAAEAGAARPAAAGGGCHTSCDVMPAEVSQQAGALFGVLETHLRGKSVSPQLLLLDAKRVAVSCCKNLANQPNLVLELAQGATGEQQVAFFNLLVTLLKLSGTPAFIAAASTGNRCSTAVASAAVRMLLLLRPTSNSHGVNAAAASAVGSSSASATSSSSSSDLSAALWLLLLGRYCLQQGSQLAQLQAEGADWAQLIRQTQQQWLEAQQGGDTPPDTASVMSCCFASDFPELFGYAECVLTVLREGCSSSAGLTAAGYDMGAVLQGFEELAACYPGVLEAEGLGDVVAGRVAGLIKALEAVGRACSVFAVPHCCNNPGCSNLAGPTEVSLVSGKGCICGGCKVARYCGKGCQQPHWKQHKPVCKMLQAATAQHT